MDKDCPLQGMLDMLKEAHEAAESGDLDKAADIIEQYLNATSSGKT